MAVHGLKYRNLWIKTKQKNVPAFARLNVYALERSCRFREARLRDITAEIVHPTPSGRLSPPPAERDQAIGLFD
jgi:hypothetical protein